MRERWQLIADRFASAGWQHCEQALSLKSRDNDLSLQGLPVWRGRLASEFGLLKVVKQQAFRFVLLRAVGAALIVAIELSQFVDQPSHGRDRRINPGRQHR